MLDAQAVRGLEDAADPRLYAEIAVRERVSVQRCPALRLTSARKRAQPAHPRGRGSLLVLDARKMPLRLHNLVIGQLGDGRAVGSIHLLRVVLRGCALRVRLVEQ
jgi:hypothetical protein